MHEVCGQTGVQHVRPLHLLCYICSPNTGFAGPHLQVIDDDGQLSSSEGSTVQGLPCGEGGESVDFELEESMEPDACFPEGEYHYSHCHHLTDYSLGVNLTLHVTLVNHHRLFVSAQAVCKSSSVVR